MPPAKVDKEALVILLDIGAAMLTMSKGSTYLQTCVDIVQMVVQRKMFAQSKDELALVLFGSRDTANELWDGSSDHFTHVTVARPLSSIDWKLLEFIQNDISKSNIHTVIIFIIIDTLHYSLLTSCDNNTGGYHRWTGCCQQ